jgi:hypothetical protein
MFVKRKIMIPIRKGKRFRKIIRPIHRFGASVGAGGCAHVRPDSGSGLLGTGTVSDATVLAHSGGSGIRSAFKGG